MAMQLYGVELSTSLGESIILLGEGAQYAVFVEQENAVACADQQQAAYARNGFSSIQAKPVALARCKECGHPYVRSERDGVCPFCIAHPWQMAQPVKEVR